ncbi:MAG: sigma-54-dependent Fis family transcriptional regulator [Nannocystaceae bacterium]|nr:sigma-54-dependent Fis family transcriptional regulator [Nannocystaceae bacterium]
MPLQPKLLRALENHETRRVGDGTYRKFDARIIAATNRDLRRMVNEGKFRADLYFRLAQMQLDIPPLRERGRGDVTLLADLFLDRFAKEREGALSFDKQAYTALIEHPWPGNVRELRNVVRYAALWTQGDKVTTTDLPPLEHIGSEPPASTSTATARPSTGNPDLEEALLLPIADAREAFDRVYVARILAEVGNNQSEAARRIDMSRSAFRELLKRLELV